MTLWCHWVAISWPHGRKEEGKLQEMSLLWAPHCWKEVGGRDLTLLQCHQDLPPCAPHLPASPELPSCWRTHSLTAPGLNSGPPDPSVVSWTPITLSLVILPSDVSMQDTAEPSPGKTPGLPDLCMKALRAESCPTQKSQQLKEKSSHRRSVVHVPQ